MTSQEPWPDSLHGCLDGENAHFSILKNIEGENQDEDENEEKKNFVNKNTKIHHAPGYDYQIPHGKPLVTNIFPESLMVISPPSSDNTSPATNSTDISPATTSSDISSIRTTSTDTSYTPTSRTDIFIPSKTSSQPSPPRSSASSNISSPAVPCADTSQNPSAKSTMFSSLGHNTDMFTQASNVNPSVFPISTLADMTPSLTASTDIYSAQTNNTSSQGQTMESDRADNSYPMQQAGIDVFLPPPPPFGSCSDISTGPCLSSDISFADAPSTDLFSSMTSSRESYSSPSSVSHSEGFPGFPKSSTDVFHPPPHPFSPSAEVFPPPANVSHENDPYGTDILPSSTSNTDMSSSFSSIGTSSSENYPQPPKLDPDSDIFQPPPPPFQSSNVDCPLSTHKKHYPTIAENENVSQPEATPESAALSFSAEKNVDISSYPLPEANDNVIENPTKAYADICALSDSKKCSQSPGNRETLPDIVNDVLGSSPKHSGIIAPTTDNRNSSSAEITNAKTSSANINIPLSTSTELFPLSTVSDFSALSTSAGISPLSSAPDISPFLSPTTIDYPPPSPPLPPPPLLDLDMFPITTPVTDISSSVSISPDIYPLTNNTTDDIPALATVSDITSLSTDADMITQPSARKDLPSSVSNTSPPNYRISGSGPVYPDTHPFASKPDITFPSDDRPRNVDRYTFSFESENSPPPSSSSDDDVDEYAFPVFPIADISSTHPINMGFYTTAANAVTTDTSMSASGALSQSSTLERRPFAAEADPKSRATGVASSLLDNKDNAYAYTDDNDNVLCPQAHVPPLQPSDNLADPLILPRFDISLLCIDGEDLNDPKENASTYLPGVDHSNQEPCMEDSSKITSTDIYPSTTTGTNVFSTSVSSSGVSIPSPIRADIPRAILEIHASREDDTSSILSAVSDDNNNNTTNNNDDSNNNNNVQSDSANPGEDFSSDSSTSSESSSLLPSEDIYPNSLTSNDYSHLSRETNNISSSLSADTYFTSTSMENYQGNNDFSPATDISSPSSDASFFTTCASPLREKVFPDIANNNFSLTSTSSSTTTDSISPSSIISSPPNNIISKETQKQGPVSTKSVDKCCSIPIDKSSKNRKRSTKEERSSNVQLHSCLELDPRASFSPIPSRGIKQGEEFSPLRDNLWRVLTDNTGVQQLRGIPMKTPKRIVKSLHSDSSLIRSIKPPRPVSLLNRIDRSVSKPRSLSLASGMSNSFNLNIKPVEVKEFHGSLPPTNIIFPVSSSGIDSPMDERIPFNPCAFNINQNTNTCIYCANANLIPPPHVFSNQKSPTATMDLLPTFRESFPSMIDSNRLPNTVTISLPGSSWKFSFITYPGESYPELMEISSPTYDPRLFSPHEKMFPTGQTKFFLDLTQLHFLGQRSKTDSSQGFPLTNFTGRSLASLLESLKLPPVKCLTNNPSSSLSPSANVFNLDSDYVQLVVRILCECRRRLWSHYVPTLVCPSDAPPRVTPAEHKLWPKLMPCADDSFKLLVVSGKLFQEVLSQDFLPIFIREFCTSLSPGSFYPGTLPLLLSSRARTQANCSIMTNRGELRNLFQRCLLAAEDSIRCLRWDDLMSTPPPALPGDPEQPLIYRGVEDDENNLADTDKLIHFDGSLSFLGDVALGEGESLSTPSSPRSISSSYSQKQKRLVFPKGIKDLDYKLLQSGISIYPGSQALDGSAVGFVFSSSPLWRNQQITSTQLAQQFLYFSSLSRKHGKSRGLTLVADVRGSTSSTVNTLLEALHLFQTNSEQDLQTVYLLANQEDQSLIKGSPLYDIHGPLKIDLLLSLEMLQSYIAMDQLPQAFDGQLDYNHESWVRFHTKLEPFMADCQLVDKYLKDSLSNITALDKIPSTYDETNRLLWEHEQQVRSVFDAPQLLLLQEEGDTILNQLQLEETYLGHSQDYKEEMLHVKKMYKYLQNSMMNLVKVAETRFHKLEQGLQLRGFENECSKLNIWISTEGRHILNKYNSCIDNLKSAKMLEDQFLKDYFSAMAYIDKGNDLVEEACMLSQSGISTDSATGYRDIVKSLKIHLKTFVDELEDTRVKVEGTAKTYHTLDKAYAWALESMKYVVSMKTENCTTEEKLDAMLRDMDTFIQEHPPISPEVFTETLNQAKQLKNEKLFSQCQRTIARCEETQSKLNSRKIALQRAKVQHLKAKSDSPCNCIVKSSGPDIDDTYLLAPALNKKTSSWHVTCTSLPTSPKLHPRRSSLPTKGEVVHISPISNLSSQNMEEYQEQLFNDGLITEDMSHRIVTSLPKSLTLRPTPDTHDCDTHGTREGGLFSRLPFSKKHMTRTVTVPVAQPHSMSQMQLSVSQTIPQMDGSLTIEPLPRTLSLILQELISTERDYVWALQLIVDNYIPEIKKEDVPQALRGKRNVIFGNIEKIYEFHSVHFLQELEKCKQQPFQIAQTFLSHEDQFYLYALYNKNKPKSDQLMQEHGTVYFRRKQSELNDKMNLSSYLLRPVQRMGKYALLLKQMLKECPESDNEFADLKNAEEMVKFHLRHGNDLLAMDSLKDCDVNLQEQGRLLRQDEFTVTQGRKKFTRHIFLFEELILFSKTKRNRQVGPESYVYKYSFKTSDIGLTENFRDKSNKFEIWFRRRSLGDNYILHAQCSEMKNSWVGEISRLLWKQAIKNRESRKCEMASMGMGNKPCMDLKGDFNINDRLINVTPTQSLARSRNSIAVTSVDHFRNGNKRPISITSLSSTSSSSSGQSANHGLLNSLNLAFEALNAGSNTATDSPHFNRRSMNSSNESGICTDIFLEGDVSMSHRGIPAGSNSAATLPANMRLLPTSVRSRLLADFNEKKEEMKDKHSLPDIPADTSEPVSAATSSTPPTTTPKQADPGRLWLDLSKIRTPPEFKPKISSINAEESEL